MELELRCEDIRTTIQEMAKIVRLLMDDVWFRTHGEDFPGQHAEMRANIMLSYRHLEDARMRIGKVMQQMQGGVSKFDKGGS